ncbi:pilus assembly protein TadG-related protein [Sphingomonas sp.]|uniref:pilus assembly protein TadG-related protein n=1 Tax=Sphingomonas sp. TaxID=28214 RepID=UPI003CC5A1E4
MSDPFSFLRRLLRNRAGNTIAMMAAAMVPLMGFAGSAVDMARLYVVKVRMQQACDAGALAGRKSMTDTSLSTPLDTTAAAQANAFFTNNFRAGWYQTTNVSFTPVKSVDGSSSTVANAVSATARATVPMAVMGFFGIGDRDLVVTCQARFDLADADVMFVLDTTGSMSCRPSDPTGCSGSIVSYTRGDGSTGYHNTETGTSGSNMSKIEALRQSVVLFDTTMRQNADPTTHFRYGFVTYSSAVNVGGVIPSQYLQNSWTYQSRHVTADYNYGNQSSFTVTGVTQTSCVAQRLPASGYLRVGPTWGATTTWSDAGYYQARSYTGVSWSAANGGTCTGNQQALRPMWRYEPVTYNTTQYLARNVIANPSRLDGTSTQWNGCIEELDTSPSSSFSVTSLPDDLNPDVTPTNSANLWRPAWPDVVWLRSAGSSYQDVKDENVSASESSNFNTNYNTTYRTGSYAQSHGFAACGMPALRLTDMTPSGQAQVVHDYVYNVDFQPFGGTYHDTGMIWGTRMMSPDGVFKNDTAPWPGRSDPTRNIIFLTDGDMAPNELIYGQYGVEQYDNRIGSNGNATTQNDRHNARFRIECDAAKRKGYVIYVIALGTSLNSDLSYCASPGQAFQTSDPQTLKDTFKAIAQRIAMLRLTQ